MQTDEVCAFQLEDNDHLVIDGKAVGYVYKVTEEEDFLLVTTKDDDGDETMWPFGPFDVVSIVTSFEDEDIPDIEEWSFSE